MANKIILFVAIFLCQFVLSGQTLNGIVYDTETKAPISYTSIGILGQNVGTVADENGIFTFSSNKLKEGDTLLISCIGYTHHLIKITSENLSNGALCEIFLKPKAALLKEITLTALRLSGISQKIGNGENIDYPHYVGVGGEKGQEIGTFFINKTKKHGILKNIVIGVATCRLERKKFRLNIYNRYININGFNTAIAHDIPIYFEVRPEHIRKGVKIDLLDFNIEISTDFIISIEEIEGSDPLNPDVTVFGKFNKLKNPCVIRSSKGYNWEIFNSNRYGGIAMIAEILY